MFIKNPFTFDPDAAHEWLTGNGPDILDGEGVDSSWGKSDADLAHAVKSLGDLLSNAPAAVFRRTEGYDIAPDALMESEDPYHLTMVILPGGVWLTGPPEKTRHLIRSKEFADAASPGLERAISAMAEIVYTANRLVNRAIDAFTASQ